MVVMSLTVRGLIRMRGLLSIVRFVEVFETATVGLLAGVMFYAMEDTEECSNYGECGNGTDYSDYLLWHRLGWCRRRVRVQ